MNKDIDTIIAEARYARAIFLAEVITDLIIGGINTFKFMIDGYAKNQGTMRRSIFTLE
jgi:hypothetical protein